MNLARRSALAFAGASILAAPRVRAADPLDALYQAARSEGQLTWYSGFLDQEICVRIGAAFSAKYKGITVNATKTTSQVAFQRLLQDLKAGAVQSDVFSSTDLSHMDYLQKKDLLVQFDAPSAAGLVPSLRQMDTTGHFYPGWVGVGGIGYNKAKLTEADVPANWSGLADPKWQDKLTFGSPIYSGVVGNWVVALEKLYGWDLFAKLNALNPLIGRSFDDAVTVLNSGERLLGLANVAGVARNAAKGNPVAVRFPADGTLVVPSATAAIAGSRSPNAAKLFVDFTCGPEYSQILAENFEQPLRTDVPPAAGGKSLADLKTLTPTLADLQKLLPTAMKQWKDTFS